MGELGCSLDPELPKTPEALRAEEHLKEFMTQAWPVMEPGTPYIHGWHIDAICEHLEAVVRGEIRDLLINMPPRHCKTLLVSVAFPCWLWTRQPSAKFLFASYAQQLSIRDSVACRRLLMSQWYQRNWAQSFSLTADQNVKQRFENDKRGYRLATSVGGQLTGEGGDYIVCFPYDALVLTEQGPLKIGDIVEKKLTVKVWSDANGSPVLKDISRWNRNPGKEILQIAFSDGSTLRCTPEHRVKTQRGWVEASKLLPWDVLPAFSVTNIEDGSLVDAKLLRKGSSRFLRSKNFSNIPFRKFCSRMRFTDFPVRILPLNPVMHTAVSPSDKRDISGCRSQFFGKIFGRLFAGTDVGHVCGGKFSVGRVLPGFYPLSSQRICDVVGARAIREVLQSVVHGIAVKMTRVLTLMTGTYKCLGNKHMHESILSRAVLAQANPCIPPMCTGLENLFGDTQREAFPHGDPCDAFHPAPCRDPIAPFISGNIRPSLIERNFSHEEATYCLTVSDTHNFMVQISNVKYIIVSNCDDPHNVKDAESDAVRTGTLEWWDKAMSTRLNNPKTGHKIIVMQRVHQDDLAGHVVEQGGYYHLCLPARYEGQKTHWIIGWQDPRKKEGELLWPERFGEPEVQKLERALGSYAAAAQLQQRPTPAEGGIFKKSWFRTYSDRPQFIRVVESWDTATSDQELAAFSVGTVWGETGTGDFYLIHVERGRYTFPKLKATVRVLHTKFNGCAVLVEDKSSGRQVCQELGRGKRIPILPVKVGKQDKIARALTVSPLVESGHVYLPENAPWLAAYMEEMLNFPNSKYKDQVDSTTQALNYLRGGSATSLMDLR